MHVARFLLVMVLLGALAGCGGGSAPKAVTPPSSTEQIKMTLNGIAETGELGSGGMTLEEEIEKLKASDAPKAEALKKDFDDLKRINDPGQVKSKAQEMLKKL